MLGRHRHVRTWHGALAEVDEVGRGRAPSHFDFNNVDENDGNRSRLFSGGSAGTCA